MIQTKSKQSIAKRVPLKGPLHNTKNQYAQVAISSQGKIELINTEEIVYLKSDGNYTKIHLADGRSLTTATTLKKYQDKLKAPTFMRVHNSYIIHRAHLKTYLHQEQKILLKNNQEIPVSRSKKEGLLRYLKMLMVSMVLLFTSTQNVNGQTFNSIAQSPNDTSDYFINVDWSVNTSSSCNCVPPASTNLNFYQNGIGIPLAGSASNPNNNPWTGSYQTSFHPGFSVSFYGEVINNSATNNVLQTPCLTLCPYNTTSNQITIAAQNLKKAINIEIMRTDTGSAELSWDVVTDIPNSNYQLSIVKNGFVIESLNDKSESSWQDPCPSIGDEYSLITRYVNLSDLIFINSPTNPIIFTQAVYDAYSPNGELTGEILTTSGSPVKDVVVTMELLNPDEISNGDCWPLTYTGITDNAGEYVIPNVYYGTGSDRANYKITPTLIDHGFNPGEIEREFYGPSSSTYQRTQDFTDTTSFVISGNVLDANGCGVDSAIISSVPPTIFVYSNSDGSYDFVVPETGEYTIKATVDTFDLGNQTVNVLEDLQDIDFNYSETDTLSIYVGAGCFEYIGQAMVDVRTKGGCLIQTVQTDLDGNALNLIIPKREIAIEVTSINPPSGSGLDANEIINEIGGELRINLDTTTQVNIFYRKPLSIELSGIPSAPCPAVEYPLFEQAKRYPVTIKVWESPGICLADTGHVIVQNNIATVGLEGAVLDTIPISNGIAQYLIFPGEPVLNAPFLKNITFTAVVDSSTTSTTINGIVSGSRQRTQTILTGAPTELPYLILRDPPGDASFSEFMEGETLTYAQSFSAKEAGDVRIWGRVAGKTPKNIVRNYGEIGAGIKAGGSQINSKEEKIVLSDFINIKTSSEQFDVGRDHDIVYGAATNFIYGLVDERIFDMNTCAMIIDTGLMFSPDTFETTFFLSIKEIRENTIPGLELVAANPANTEAETVKFKAEIKKWERVIQYNEELREEALEDAINLTLDDDGSVTFTKSKVRSKSKSLVTSQFINADIALKAGIDILDETLVVEGGLEVNIRGEWGQSVDSSITETTTAKFTFHDTGNYDDDLFSFDYAIDGTYGTYVFGNPIGRSSCPHEMGTQFIDFPQIVALNPVQYTEGNEDFLLFDLAIRNYSESNDTRLYHIRFLGDDGSARVSFGDAPLSTDDIIPRTLAAGEEQILKIKVEQIDPDVFSFEGLAFRMYPACQTSLYSETFISAYFENDCPFVSMPLPNNNFIINEANNNLIGVVMDGYNLDPDIDHIKMQYLKIGSTNWMESNIDIPGANLVTPPHQYFWDVNGIEDGEYSIRWELKCGNTINVSPRKSGVIDRKPPRVFGSEKPSDDTYFPGDDIGVTFNEIIDILDLQNGNFYVTNLSKNQSVPAGISADGKTVFVDLAIKIDTLYNQSFEVGLIGVKDMYGNARPDTVKWNFLVSEPDSDRDGVGDLTDRCPGGDDCEDTDMDGIPDDCDCLPTISQNGTVNAKAAMDFDGFNDFITIQNNNALIPTSTNAVTYETWIFPAETTNELGHITTSGAFPNSNHQIYFYNSTGKIIVDGTGVNPIVSTDSISPNKWTHVAVVFDRTQTFLYINGELDATRNATLHANNLGFDIAIGNQFTGSPDIWNFDGRMEEFRVWNTARTAQEIKSHMMYELEGNETGLELYFDFNEGIPFGENANVPTVLDKSGNGNNGTPSNFIQSGSSSNWVFSPQGIINAQYDLCRTCTDTLNAAIDFDGVNDYLLIPNNPALVPTTTNEMTFELWLNPSTPNAETNVIIFIDANLYIARSANRVQVFSSQFVSPLISIPENEWTHLAFSFKTDSLMVLKDGQVEFSNAFSLNNINAGNPILIGEFLTTPNFYAMDGKMDDIRFWDHARTADQIRENMFHEMLGTETGLVAYFDFNEGIASDDNKSRTFAEDKTGNGNNANFVNLRQDGGYSNYVPSALNFRIDEDEDGRPDACDSCIPQINLMLENTTLSGTYKARDKIILGNNLTIPQADTIYLRAPKIEVLNTINAPNSTKIFVSNRPCDE